ncbi:MAG TPA: hypothetical protein VIH88_01525 [Candidatus Acidoferrales bacterium]
MTNPVGAISFNPQVAQALAPAAKPAVNVAKATPQDSVNISAAGRAASQAQPALKASTDVNHDGDSK